MKKIFLTALIAAAGTFAFAQEKTAPRTEYTVELSSNNLEIKAGETKDITVQLNRSKSYAKSKATLGISSSLPQGITITFEPAEGVIGNSVAHIAVAADARVGNYMIILNSSIQNKSKGATLKLSVKDSKDEVASAQ